MSTYEAGAMLAQSQLDRTHSLIPSAIDISQLIQADCRSLQECGGRLQATNIEIIAQTVGGNANDLSAIISQLAHIYTLLDEYLERLRNSTGIA